MVLTLAASMDGTKSQTTAALLATAVAVPVCGLILQKLVFRERSKGGEHNTGGSILPYPPGPPGSLLFGNMFSGQPDFENGENYDTLNLATSKEYGLTFSVNIPVLLGRIIITADPELAKKILVTKNYPKPMLFYGPLAPLIGPQSLVTLTGQEWAGMRKAFNPGFAPTFLAGMVDTMAQKMERFLAKIDKDIQMNEPTNMLSEAQSFTSDVIVQIAFGEDWGNTDEKHPARRLEDEIGALYQPMANSALRRTFDFPRMLKMKQVGKELDDEMRRILERRLDAGAESTEKNARDILSLAINHIATDKEGAQILTASDKSFIVDQLKTFYFAGHDTTATTIAWAMWELSRHPESLTELRNELKENNVWQTKNFSSTGAPTFEQLQKCSYLEGVVKESLRLYPPASGLSRKCENDYETFKGFRIGGAYLIVNSYVMHRHPDLWKNPDEFRPQRFIDSSEGDINSKFLAFSKGKRDCIGKYFALLEAKLAVSALAMRYSMECEDPTDRMEQVITNLPRRGAKVKFSLLGAA